MARSIERGGSFVKVDSPEVDRRLFVCGAPALCSALATSGTMPRPASAKNEPRNSNLPVYEETALIRRYYESARY